MQTKRRNNDKFPWCLIPRRVCGVACSLNRVSHWSRLLLQTSRGYWMRKVEVVCNTLLLFWCHISKLGFATCLMVTRARLHVESFSTLFRRRRRIPVGGNWSRLGSRHE